MNRRGLTLPELMVACSVFFMAVLAILAIERTSRLASFKEDVRTDTYRATMLTVEHLRRELHGGLVTLVTPTRLDFRTPLLDPAGEPRVDGAGEPLWDPPDPESYSIAMKPGGDVELREPNGPGRLLGHLGNAGKLTFLDVDPTRSDLVQITVLAKVSDPHHPEKSSEFQADFKVFFANQP